MFKNQDFGLRLELPWNEQALTRDLELATLFNAMSPGDEFLFDVAKKAVLSSVIDKDTILYRQDILKDCLKNPAIARAIYNVAVEAIERKQRSYFGILSKYPGSILSSSIEALEAFTEFLKKLRNIADEHSGRFESEGLRTFFAMLKRELTDEYFEGVQNHLAELKFPNGVQLSAGLGEGLKGQNYVLHKSTRRKIGWLDRLFHFKEPGTFTFRLHPRDTSGARTIAEIKDKGINTVANVLAQSADHILEFFNMLRIELGFYIGCLNLNERLAVKGEPVCFPVPTAFFERTHSFKGLYDVCMALIMKQRVAGNDVDAGNKNLVVITGANQGGKSTFLRSIGLAQLMMQCGMFVPAEAFSSNICGGIFTHFKREEDIAMKSGKLDEELRRMAGIADNLKTADSLVLFNESFAATNEREGSEIAGQIVSALTEKNVKVFFVTHLYEFARNFYDKKTGNAMFLRAERLADGRRTFKLLEGGPLQTSFGKDLYNTIFGDYQASIASQVKHEYAE